MKSSSCSSFISGKKIDLFVQVCGGETVSTVGSDTIHYNVIIGKDEVPIVLAKEDIEQQF